MIEIVNGIVPAHVQGVFVALYAGLAILALSVLIAKAAGREADREDPASPVSLGDLIT